MLEIIENIKNDPYWFRNKKFSYLLKFLKMGERLFAETLDALNINEAILNESMPLKKRKPFFTKTPQIPRCADEEIFPGNLM